LRACRVKKVTDVQALGRHVQLPALRPPGRSRPIGIHLDPESVGIAQIQRLAHRVIRAARVLSQFAEMAHEPAERSAIRHQDREVVQPEPPTGRHRTRLRPFVQPDYWLRVSFRA
jgi:hypothetical protein